MASQTEDLVASEVQLDVPHIQQRYSWDCGLACAQMLLTYFEKSLDNFKEICAQLNFGTSVWTIDLAYLMYHYGINFTYTTITLGVDKGYSSKSFYKDKFTSDEARVNEMFEQAYSKQINIEKRSIDTGEITTHLSSGRPVLVLIDWNYLSCKWCDSKFLPKLSCVGRCLGNYQGHYILLCGYNKTERLFYYKNPAFKKTLCCCTYKTLDAARKSYGTDEDVLFINTWKDGENPAKENGTTNQGAGNVEGGAAS